MISASRNNISSRKTNIKDMKKIVMMFASLLMVGCSNPVDDGSTEKQPDASLEFKKYADEDEIKVMSFNIRTDSSSDGTNGWSYRKSACVEMIKDQKPTIIGFQEAKFTLQWSYMKEQLKDDYVGFGVSRTTGKESGSGECMGIMYDKNVVEKLDGGTFWLSETPNEPSKGWDSAYTRSSTWGLFKHKPTGKTFFYINTHLDNEGNTARIEGMKLIAKRFEPYKDKCPIFLTGDMNVDLSDKAMQAIRDFMWNTRLYAPIELTDFKGTYNGFSTKTSNKIIDHIYCSKGMKVVEYHTITEKYGSAKFVSDHYPIYSIIKME
jgi:endonuclease/exonuclease/phosphatase family metal-dependent hydrolase